MMILVPCKKPLNLGFSSRWSLMNFTFTVSIGVTASMASDTPAPSPHNTLWAAVNSPFPPVTWVLRASKAPNLSTIITQNHNMVLEKEFSLYEIYLTADLGIDP